PGLTEQILAGHVRALQPGHLEDVASDDRHTVKPWFDGRIDFAPPVKDLAAQRFPLKGGRLDYLAGRPVAALVYQRDKHLIDLFVWPAADSGAAAAPTTALRQGYNLVHWMQNGMNFWAVSDVEAAQLREFAEDWRDRRADRIGAIAVLDADHLGNSGEPLGYQKSAAAHRDQWHLAGLVLHPVDRVFELGSRLVEHCPGELARHAGRLPRIADFD